MPYVHLADCAAGEVVVMTVVALSLHLQHRPLKLLLYYCTLPINVQYSLWCSDDDDDDDNNTIGTIRQWICLCRILL